jgi:hypothetical protein
MISDRIFGRIALRDGVGGQIQEAEMSGHLVANVESVFHDPLDILTIPLHPNEVA